MDEGRIARILELEAEAREHEDSADGVRWEQARLVAEELATGTLQKDLAQRLGCKREHVSRLGRLAQEYGGDPPTDRTFWQAYDMLSNKHSRESMEAGIPPRVRRAQRQVPVLHQDRVEMAEKLMADDAVADDVFARDPALKMRDELRRQVRAAEPVTRKPEPEPWNIRRIIDVRNALHTAARTLEFGLAQLRDVEMPDGERDRLLTELHAIRVRIDWFESFLKNGDRSFDDELQQLLEGG